ncbi:MAG TPA: hypothetical protein VF846_15305 [Thermoanaerobaculia bacterium]
MRGTEAPLAPAPDFTVEQLERSVDAQLNFEARSVEEFDDMALGVVEITDDGLVNPSQKEQVFDLVGKRIRNEQNSLLVVFVHGWHHGPSVCDRDLACFRRVLHRLANSKELLERNVHVTGVYVGWRGESLNRPWNNFTLWDRKNVAQHIGRTGAKEVLLELDAMYNEVKRARPSSYMTMVTVGHSLGGALVFSAMKGMATGNAAGIVDGSPAGRTHRIVRAEGDRESAAKRQVKATRARLGDLVVLVNPAIEADEYKPFHADLPDSDTGSYRPGPDKALPYDEDQLPVLMAIASEADEAVGKAFVAGRWVSAFRYPKIALDRSQRIGIGHYKPHITHTLRYPDVEFEEKKVACGCPKQFDAPVNIDNRPVDLTSREKQDFGDLELELASWRDKAKWDVHSPYLVVRASRGVMREHSDIYNPVFVEFLTKFIRGYYTRAAQIQQRNAVK